MVVGSADFHHHFVENFWHYITKYILTQVASPCNQNPEEPGFWLQGLATERKLP